MLPSETPKRKRDHDWSEHPDLLDFFSRMRNRPEHLYPSERAFLPSLAAEHHTVLDVGCAGGGFFEIFRHYRSDIRYVGADFSHALTSRAGQLHADGQFLVADSAQGLPFADGSLPYVQALGWLHWEPRHFDALREMWRITTKHLFFDMRLSPFGRKTIVGEQRIAYSMPWDGRTVTPYIAVGWDELVLQLMALDPAAIQVVGYWGRPADTVTGMDCEVCFVTCVLEKRSATQASGPCRVTLDAPLDWPLCASQYSVDVSRLHR